MSTQPQQKPLELILARNLLTALSTPGFLVDVPGRIIFFNEAAGAMFGQRFEETGPVTQEQWRTQIGPFDERGRPIPFFELPLTIALRNGRPGHARHRLRPADGEEQDFEVSGVPLIASSGGFRGAVLLFWPSEEHSDEESES